MICEKAAWLHEYVKLYRLVFVYLYSAVRPIVNIPVQINELALYSRKLQSFFNAESTIESPKVRTGRELTVKTGDMPFAVDLKNVSFSYDNSNFALKNISMSIKPGQIRTIILIQFVSRL